MSTYKDDKYGYPDWLETKYAAETEDIQQDARERAYWRQQELYDQEQKRIKKTGEPK